MPLFNVLGFFCLTSILSDIKIEISTFFVFVSVCYTIGCPFVFSFGETMLLNTLSLIVQEQSYQSEFLVENNRIHFNEFKHKIKLSKDIR